MNSNLDGFARDLINQVRLAYIQTYLTSGVADEYESEVCQRCGELTIYSGGHGLDQRYQVLCLSDDCLAQKIQDVLDEGGVFDISMCQ